MLRDNGLTIKALPSAFKGWRSQTPFQAQSVPYTTDRIAVSIDGEVSVNVIVIVTDVQSVGIST